MKWLFCDYENTNKTQYFWYLQNFQNWPCFVFCKTQNYKIVCLCRSLECFKAKNVHFKAKNVYHSFVKNFVKFCKNFAITKIMICFDSFNNFKTGRVLYFAKLQNTKIIVYCRSFPKRHSFLQKGLKPINKGSLALPCGRTSTKITPYP